MGIVQPSALGHLTSPSDYLDGDVQQRHVFLQAGMAHPNQSFSELILDRQQAVKSNLLVMDRPADTELSWFTFSCCLQSLSQDPPPSSAGSLSRSMLQRKAAASVAMFFSQL